jgi:hypothetical protein
VPCPYARLIVGTRHCRVLAVSNINSDDLNLVFSIALLFKF